MYSCREYTWLNIPFEAVCLLFCFFRIWALGVLWGWCLCNDLDISCVLGPLVSLLQALIIWFPFYNKGHGIPWQSSGWEFAIPLQGVWVQSLVRELGSPMLCSVAGTVAKDVNQYSHYWKHHGGFWKHKKIKHLWVFLVGMSFLQSHRARTLSLTTSWKKQN